MTSRIAIVLALTCSVAIGCGDEKSPTAPSSQSATTADITVTVSPNPVIASACTPTTCLSGFDFAALFTVQISETAGVGGNVNFVNVTLRNTTTGIEIGTVNVGADEVIRRVPTATNHVNARGSLSIVNLGVTYRLTGGGRQGTLTVTVQFTDDRGNQINRLVNVPVV